MGAIGGALFHGIKGFRNAPSVRMFLFKILFKLIQKYETVISTLFLENGKYMDKILYI